MERLGSGRVPEDPQKLSEEILQAREHRRRVEAEFDAFTNSFQRRQAQPAAPIVPAPRESDAHQEIRFDRHAAAPSPEVANEPDAVPDVPQAVVRPPRTQPRDRRVLIAAGVGVALVVALGAAMFATRGRERARGVGGPDAVAAAAPEAAPNPTAASPTLPQTPAAANPPVASAPAAPAAVASGVNVEI